MLDLAAGSGRHSLYLAKLGFTVLAVDRDAGALELLTQSKSGLVIQSEHLDLEGSTWPLADRSGFFDAVVVTNYLYRPYLDLLPDLLPIPKTQAWPDTDYGDRSPQPNPAPFRPP